MTKMAVRSLLDPCSTYHIHIDLANYLGSGRQGTVYPVVGSNGLVKIYSDASAKRHVAPLVRHIVANCLIKASTSLSGLPFEAFETEDGQVGLLMARAPGETMGEKRYAKCASLPLHQRLVMASGLADGVAALHQHDVVLADLAEANLLYDYANSRIFLVDVDGGGIMRGDGYRLKPAVCGHDQGSLLPLEVRHGRTASNLASDDWSLAVLLHRLLSAPAGADPFFYGSDYRVLEGDEAWPLPRNGQTGPLQRYLKQHSEGLALLGPRLLAAFQQTFGPGGRHHAGERVSARRWVRDLTVASCWVYICTRCGSEFVAEKRRTCPHCQTPIQHALLETHRQRLPLWQRTHAFSLHRLGLGPSRTDGLRFQREHDRVQLEVGGGDLHVENGRRPHLIGAGEQVRFKPGKYRCRFRTSSRQEVSFQLTVPAGQWPGFRSKGPRMSPSTANRGPRI